MGWVVGYLATSTPTPKQIPTPVSTPSPAPTPSGVVFGFVEDADKQPLEGVTVAIKGEFSDSTETDEDGYYEFGGLPKGKYTITYENRQRSYAIFSFESVLLCVLCALVR